MTDVTKNLPALDALADRINTEHNACNAARRKGLEHAIEAGQLLSTAKEGLPHGEWLPWLKANCPDISERTAARYMRFASNPEQLKAESATVADMTLREADQIMSQQDRVVPIRADTSGNDEWYTPTKYIDMAKRVMGGIDLDPASCAFAQKNINAEVFYTEADDGLSRGWHGRVWLNPPYSKGLIDKFVEKVVAAYQEGDVEQAIVLTSNFSDTAWFHRLMTSSSAVCFTKGRVRFYNEGGVGNAPTSGHAFFYFGPNVETFAEKFSEVGHVYRNELNISSRLMAANAA